MKYLENEKLTELTADLSEVPIGDSARVINGHVTTEGVYRFRRRIRQEYEIWLIPMFRHGTQCLVDPVPSPGSLVQVRV